MYALGNLRWTDGPNSRRDDPTPYFDMIFVRKERTAEGKANERSGEENRQDGERMSAERSQLTSEGAEDRKFPKR